MLTTQNRIAKLASEIQGIKTSQAIKQDNVTRYEYLLEDRVFTLQNRGIYPMIIGVKATRAFPLVSLYFEIEETVNGVTYQRPYPKYAMSTPTPFGHATDSTCEYVFATYNGYPDWQYGIWANDEDWYDEDAPPTDRINLRDPRNYACSALITNLSGSPVTVRLKNIRVRTDVPASVLMGTGDI